ncbi:MAG: dTDP-4-dehydrorhamnose 3,5-epimerase [Leptolinea sp.]|jgi:dTDP-4-dehydrorhamnose 3,5-epimerase|nr:dTDP-4-dehydrorhamnose 3,5-epimerase [Leptolinea sp.]
MIFQKTDFDGVYVIEPEPRSDNRGFFARVWCEDELSKHHLNTRIAQCSISFNKFRGTLRGMHFQDNPFPETKIVRCTMGSIFDVVIDLRSDSPTYTRWFSVELSQENRRMLYIPHGFAHGFQTLTDGTEIYYQISEFFHPECSRGVRWNDPCFSIDWPLGNPILSDRDLTYPDYFPAAPSSKR